MCIKIEEILVVSCYFNVDVQIVCCYFGVNDIDSEERVEHYLEIIVSKKVSLLVCYKLGQYPLISKS